MMPWTSAAVRPAAARRLADAFGDRSDERRIFGSPADPLRLDPISTIRCCAPSCRIRAIRRGSASAATTMRRLEVLSCSVRHQVVDGRAQIDHQLAIGDAARARGNGRDQIGIGDQLPIEGQRADVDAGRVDGPPTALVDGRPAAADPRCRRIGRRPLPVDPRIGSPSALITSSSSSAGSALDSARPSATSGLHPRDRRRRPTFRRQRPPAATETTATETEWSGCCP